MARATIDRLIVNSPCEEPARYRHYDRTTRRFDLAVGRRPAGYVVASLDSKVFDDPGVFVEIPLVKSNGHHVFSLAPSVRTGDAPLRISTLTCLVAPAGRASAWSFTSVQEAVTELRRAPFCIHTSLGVHVIE